MVAIVWESPTAIPSTCAAPPLRGEPPPWAVSLRCYARLVEWDICDRCLASRPIRWLVVLAEARHRDRPLQCSRVSMLHLAAPRGARESSHRSPLVFGFQPGSCEGSP